MEGGICPHRQAFYIARVTDTNRLGSYLIDQGKLDAAAQRQHYGRRKLIDQEVEMKYDCERAA